MPPYWKRWAVGALAVVTVLAIALSWSRFKQDFWPLDRSFIGPNILASVMQWIVVAIVGVLIYPPLRRRVHAFFDVKLAGLKSHLDHRHDSLHERLDALDAYHEHLLHRIKELHDKLDHE